MDIMISVPSKVPSLAIDSTGKTLNKLSEKNNDGLNKLICHVRMTKN